MNPKTLKALQGSIKKWEGIIVDTAIDKGAINCPLCELFLGGRCKECPVAKAVNSIYCEDTPYIEYHRHNINVIFYGEEEIDQRKKDKLKFNRNFEHIPDIRSVLIAIDEDPTKKVVTRNGR